MGSRLDPAFGGLGVGAPGRYLSGGSFFRIYRVAAGFHRKTNSFLGFLYFGNAVFSFFRLGSFRINLTKSIGFIMVSAFIV